MNTGVDLVRPFLSSSFGLPPPPSILLLTQALHRSIVLPDLTLPTNVFLCRQWTSPLPSSKDPKGRAKGGDPSFLGRIRLIRIEKDDTSAVTVVCEGAREGEWEEDLKKLREGPGGMEVDEEEDEEEGLEDDSLVEE